MLMCVLSAGGELSCESNPCVTFHRPDGTLRARLFGLQGGGLYISGTATLTNTNVYSNHGNLWGARTFCPCPDISSIAPLEC